MSNKSKRAANGVAAYRAKAAFLEIEGYERLNKRQIKARLVELGGWLEASRERYAEWEIFWKELKLLRESKLRLAPNPNSRASLRKQLKYGEKLAA